MTAVRWRRVLAVAAGAALLIAYVLVRYGDAVLGFFFLDDFWLLRGAVESSRSPAGPAQLFLPGHTGFHLYRPLTQAVYFFLLHAAFGTDPSGYHLVQLACFALNAILAMLVAARASGSLAAGLCAALLYAAAPGHGVAVVWIAAFTMVGTTTAVFAMILCWQVMTWPWRALAVTVLQCVALLCSEHAVVAPLLLLLVSAFGSRAERWRAIARDGAGPLLVVVAYAGLKLVYFATAGWPAYGYTIGFSPGVWLMNLGRYAAATSNVLTLAEPSGTAAVGLGLLVSGVALVATVRALRGGERPRLVALGVDVFVVALLPVLVLPKHYYDYFVGVAALGAALAVVGALRLLVGRRHFVWAAAAVAIGVLALDARTGDRAARGTPVFKLVRNAFADNQVLLMNLERLRRIHGPDVEIIVPNDRLTATMIKQGDAGQVFFAPPLRVRLSTPAPARGAVSPGVFLDRPIVPLAGDQSAFWLRPGLEWIRRWLPRPRTWYAAAFTPPAEMPGARAPTAPASPPDRVAAAGSRRNGRA